MIMTLSQLIGIPYVRPYNYPRIQSPTYKPIHASIHEYIYAYMYLQYLNLKKL